MPNLAFNQFPFTSKIKHKKDNLKFNIFGKQFLAPKVGTICFGPGQRKIKVVFSFSSFLAFKQTKEQILVKVQPLYILNKTYFLPILG